MNQIRKENYIREINIEDYEKLEKIGHGGFGTVYKVRDKQTNNLYAAKILTKAEPKKIMREVKIPESIEHPCILRMRGFCTHDFDGGDYPMILTEYIPNGSLFSMLEKQRGGLPQKEFDDTTKYINMYGIAKGMQYLHKNNIIHRDLKPHNVLLNDRYYPIICDFGLSKIVDPNERDMQSTVSGTCIYQAPEIFNNANLRYNEKVDVYAYGIVLYEIVTGLIPFSSCKNVLQIINQHKDRSDFRPDFPENKIDEEMKSIIQECWHHDPNRRPSFDEIVEKLYNQELAKKMNVDWEKFQKYHKFVSESRECYDPNASVTFTPLDNVTLSLIEKSLKLYPLFELQKLDENCREIVKEAENGDVDKLCEVGLCLIEGKGFPRNPELGMRYLNKAIEKGSIVAKISKASIYYEGKYVPKNNQRALEIIDQFPFNYQAMLIKVKIELEKKNPDYNDVITKLRTLKSRMNDEALIIGIKLFMTNKIKSKSFNETIKYSFEFAKAAARKGNPEAQAYLSLFYYYGYGVVDFDFEKAAELSQISYEKGKNMMGGAIYAECLAKGRGTAKDENKAVEIAKESSENNNSKGMNKYGEFLNIGIGGIKQDKKKAAELWKKSAEQGDAEGKFLYASCLLEGEEYGVIKDHKKAIKLLKESIEEGCITAKALLGQLQIQGLIVKENNVDGIKLIKEAADLGDDYAIIIYSHILIKGIGTSVNYDEAFKYLKIGKKRKNADCYRMLGELVDNGYIDKGLRQGSHYIAKADTIEWNSEGITQILEEKQKKLDEIEKKKLDEETEQDIYDQFNPGCLIF